MNSKQDFIFGPVYSRRLGRSLGIDAVPFKTCTYDCIYCQLGRNELKTVQPRRFFDSGPVIEELKNALSNTEPDCITVSGSGEPTLNSGLGELIKGIKKITDTPLCVLTNGSLLYREEVRERLAGADIIIPSLDASCDKTFRMVNRPHGSIDFFRMLEGLEKLRSSFKGKLFLEIMFVEGVNDKAGEVDAFKTLIERIKPDMVQLNTVARPPAEDGVSGVNLERLQQIERIFGPKARIILPGKRAGGLSQSMENAVRTARRRPLSVEDICEQTGMDRDEALKQLILLEKQGILESRNTGGTVYYHAARRRNSSGRSK